MRKIFIGLFLVAAYFFSRLVNLTLLPIFTDEAIYIHWTQIAEGDAAWRFISLVDGKLDSHLGGEIGILAFS